MRKFGFATLFFAVILTCSAVMSAEMDEWDAEEQALLEAMSKEPPLTQNDIDMFLKFAPQLEELSDDEEAVAKLITDSGMSGERFQYAASKISMGMLMVMMPTMVTREMILESGETPEFMIPSEDEVKLLEKNMDAFQALMQQEVER